METDDAGDSMTLLRVIDNLRAGDINLARAFESFVCEMSEKLQLKSAQGYNGWSAESCASLRQSIASHLLKGDPVDVANLALFWRERQRAFTEMDDDPKPDDELIHGVIARLRAGDDVERVYEELDARFTALREELRILRGKAAEV